MACELVLPLPVPVPVSVDELVLLVVAPALELEPPLSPARGHSNGLPYNLRVE